MILARGVTPAFSAASSVIRTQAAAPSLRVLALAAVTVPPSSSLTNAGLRLLNLSKLALCTCTCISKAANTELHVIVTICCWTDIMSVRTKFQK